MTILAKTGDKFQSPAKLANEVTNRRPAGMVGKIISLLSE
jgi:hypothetical protein